MHGWGASLFASVRAYCPYCTGAHRVAPKPIVGIVRRGEYATATFCKQVQLQWWVKNPPYEYCASDDTGGRKLLPHPNLLPEGEGTGLCDLSGWLQGLFASRSCHPTCRLGGIVCRGEYATATFCKQVQLQWWGKNPPYEYWVVALMETGCGHVGALLGDFVICEKNKTPQEPESGACGDGLLSCER